MGVVKVPSASLAIVVRGLVPVLSACASDALQGARRRCHDEGYIADA